MTKRPKHEGKRCPSADDETIRRIRQEATSLAEEARTMTEVANEYSENAKKRLDRIVERDDAQRRDAKRNK